MNKTLAVVALLLTGCAAEPVPVPVPVPHFATQEEMRGALDQFTGKNIKEMVAKIGYPDSQRMILGANTYTWSRDQGQFVCKIDVTVDANNIVMQSYFSGNPGGCSSYWAALIR